MEQPANDGRYILSEIEVMGKGGLLAQPAAAPASTKDEIRLSGGNWKVQRASEVTASGEEISKPSFSPENWIVATVPGTVLSSYKNIGAIPNPNYADNLMQISESFFNSNFWYRDEFEVPEGFKQDRLFLNFDGINWKANVYLNGNKIGRIEGAFIRGVFDVTDRVVPGKNVVAVEIIKNEHIGAIKEKCEKNTDFNGGILGADNPTFHASIGWDWISTIRGRNIGIWDDVYLTSTGKVTIQDPFVQVVLPLPDTTSATLTPEVIVKNHDAAPVKGILTGKIGDITFEQPVELAANEEKSVAFDPNTFSQLKVQNPRLWWPKGYGSPYLYDANFTFKVGDKVSDSEDFKVGIRQMTFNENNSILSLFINGRRFIGRGGNWGFGESNLNYRGREYDIAVAYHADMNFTMMRNWVGQIGDKELYEACDRHGIMIWQDFSFGTGHSSTSISAALGMAVAAKMNGEEDRQSVAIIGDGAMTGGLAFEGLNNAGINNANLLVILNDNNMAIDPNVGGINEYLMDITTSKTYNKLKDDIWHILGRINKISPGARNFIQKMSHL